MSTERVVTASTEVSESYYNMPVIKAPHWRWLVINYFFLAALTGSTSTIATLAELFSGDRALVRAGRYLSFAALLPCPPLLVLDLGRPERFLNMLRIVKLKSPMSLGSWALSFHGLFCGALAALQLLADLTGRDLLAGPRRALGIAGLPFAVFVSGYTGLLLAATNVPLWARNYLLLGPTFIASAFSSGFAALSILLESGDRLPGFKLRNETVHKMARAETICLATELALLTVGIAHLGKLGKPLTTGTWGRLFWPITYLAGIVTPLALRLSGLTHDRRDARTRRSGAALLVLTGGYVLRMLMILAGRESANRPRDYFEYTRGSRV